MKYFCTYFDKGFVRRALALYTSIQKNLEIPFTLYALCFDDDAFKSVSKIDLKGLIPLHIQELTDNDKDLAGVIPHRSKVEFYFTCTAAFTLYLLKNFKEIDQLIYLDADIFFFSSPLVLFDEIQNASISIIEHRYASNLKCYEKNGIYNVSWVGFRKDENGIAALEWWRERCLEWCYDRHENGKYADQRYLDDWPSRFKNVHIIKNIGANVAPWNIKNYVIGFDGKVPTVNSCPIIFFHFHGLKKIRDNIYDPNLFRYKVVLNSIIAERIYIPYIRSFEVLNDFAPFEYTLRGSRFSLIIRKLLKNFVLQYKLMNGQLIKVKYDKH